MQVLKRNGKLEDVSYDKITNRIRDLISEGNFSIEIDAAEIAQKVIHNMVSGITTEALDHLASETCAYMATRHPEFLDLAGSIEISNLHKKTKNSFVETMIEIQKTENILQDEFIDFIQKHATFLESILDYQRDYRFDYFGFKTLEKSYLLKSNGIVIERPQHMFLRTAVYIWMQDENLSYIKQTYEDISLGRYTHATPTLFNSGLRKSQLASCFLMTVGDSINEIYKSVSDSAVISQMAGGIGISIHHVRGKGAKVRGTNGVSNGIVPMVRVFNETARYVDQGGGKRKGAFAMYLEPWHPDILDFLDLKLNHGKEELRARDLFYALWIPDLFMERVEQNAMWSLMDPNTAKGLADVYGDNFEKLYKQYEAEEKYVKQIPARVIWDKIIASQLETGVPYMLYKDHANKKSNQKNLGTIYQSNLCAEIIQYSSAEETAVCNLGSVALGEYAPEAEYGQEMSVDAYRHHELYIACKQIVRNLNQVIDRTYYPIEETKRSNLRHRPIGLGVQGLADAFFKMRFPFESAKAKQLNREIFETMYFAAMETSIELAQEYGVYSSYEGSPLSQGIFQYQMWGLEDKDLSPRWDWKQLREKLMKYGARNSLLIALMPTASTAQILGNNECFEPLTSNILARRVLSGDFVLVNSYMVKDFINLGIWDESLKDSIILHKGSVQHLDIPQDLKDLYKTVWEISQKTIVDLAADRGVFVCQSQSMNIFMEEPTYNKVTSLHFYTWRKGLKTGMYYLRQKPKAAVQFTIENTYKPPIPVQKKVQASITEDIELPQE